MIVIISYLPVASTCLFPILFSCVNRQVRESRALAKYLLFFWFLNLDFIALPQPARKRYWNSMVNAVFGTGLLYCRK